MRGTPGFAGERLKEAREARGLTAVSLAELVGVTPQSVSKYEHDDSSPSADVLEVIARTLNLPLSFFTLAPRKIEESAVFFRSMSAATKQARTRARRKLDWLRDMTVYLEEFIDFPEPNLPDLRLPDDPLLISDDDIENAAEDARRFWGMGDSPVGNVVLLLENQGVVVARQQLGAESLDSLSTWALGGGRPFVMIGTDKGSAVRWRFDVAHELGHLLLHAHVGPRELVRPEQFKRIEEQAHRFAAAFLLPMEPFCEDLFAISLDAMRALKPKWKTSIALMIVRARQASLMSEESEKRLWMGLNRRRWRRQEPYDDTWPPEEPRLTRRAAEMILASGTQTVDDVISRVHLPASEIERLTGLPTDYLSGDFARVRVRTIRNAEERDDRGDRPPAEVVRLGPRRRADT